MDRALILAGDVGGTKVYLGLYDPAARGFDPLVEARYVTADYPSLGALLIAFVEQSGHRPDRVVLGVPGPVRQTPVRGVNLPWLVDPEELRAALKLDAVYLLNDLEATSYGTQALPPQDVATLNQGARDEQGSIAVIAAGTGLGEGGLCWTGHRYVSIPSEGGHADFAPGDALQTEFYLYLREKFGHVSWERVLSGPGLVHVYEFLRDSDRGQEPEWLRQELAGGDRAGTISKAGLEARCDLAVQALDLFVSLYGAEAGNLALKVLATGGVFVGGGIAPKILLKLQEGGFMQAFVDKGRLAETLGTMPVKVILNDKTALLGAAYWGTYLQDKT